MTDIHELAENLSAIEFYVASSWGDKFSFNEYNSFPNYHGVGVSFHDYPKAPLDSITTKIIKRMMEFLSDLDDYYVTQLQYVGLPQKHSVPDHLKGQSYKVFYFTTDQKAVEFLLLFDGWIQQNDREGG